MIRILLIVLLSLPAGMARARARAVPGGGDAHTRAEALYQRSLELLSRNTVETRQQALRALEQVTALEPDNATYQLTLGRAYYASGFLRSARQCYERVVNLQPEDAAAHRGVGLVWRRDWMRYLDRTSLDRAVEQLEAAGRLDSTNAEVWLELAPLQLEQGDLSRACASAFHALRSDFGSGDAHLAVAHALYRSGMLRQADSAYRATMRRINRPVRERFEDIAPVASEADTAVYNHLPAREKAAFVERFWRENDPDLSTPENEALLEYWARVTQAYFLFYDAKRRNWDERGEVYARYGPPSDMRYNPIGSWAGINFGNMPPSSSNLLVWHYPELGMVVTLQDRVLTENYMLPPSMSRDMDPLPDPAVLAQSADALGMRSGRGVFHLLPPCTTPLALETRLARFQGPGGPRMLVQLETAGGPADSLWADWTVVDSAEVVRARASTMLGPSACSATTRRVAEFAAELPAGAYRVNVTVHDAGDGRGILRRGIRLAPPPAELALSDVVTACGTPEAGGSTVRIEPNPGARVTGAGPLTAYFEIYHLKPDQDGLARFEYVYAVRATAPDSRHWVQKLFSPTPGPLLSVSRQEQHLGDVRRQFISVPAADLLPGRYRLEILVRDLVAGEETFRTLEFVKAI